MIEESLFAAVLDRTFAADRQAFLEEACAGDVALRERVERLLAADEETAGILDQQTGITEAAADMAGTGRGSLRPVVSAGTQVAGRYTLLKKIGEGGMGTVWMAEQTCPVRRRVAIKIIKPDLARGPVIARFEAE